MKRTEHAPGSGWSDMNSLDLGGSLNPVTFCRQQAIITADSNVLCTSCRFYCPKQELCVCPEGRRLLSGTSETAPELCDLFLSARPVFMPVFCAQSGPIQDFKIQECFLQLFYLFIFIFLVCCFAIFLLAFNLVKFLSC